MSILLHHAVHHHIHWPVAAARAAGPAAIARQLLWTLPALLALLTLTGCATPLSQFGDQARFSPAFRGYVLAQQNGSDDPSIGDTVLVLRDPLTGDKLRCREQVLQWREIVEDVAIDRVTDDNAAIAAATTTGVVFAPLLAMQPVGGLATVEAILVGNSLYSMMNSDTPDELLLKGIALFRRTRYAPAASHLERALAKDASVGVLNMAYYYLGLAYAKMGNDERAQLALWMFVNRAGVRDVEAYRKAEAALEELGASIEECDSTDPVRVYF